MVAEEVRKLAEESQGAAKHIASLIGQIQGDTKDAVNAMQRGNGEVQQGTAIVGHTGQTFKEIETVNVQVDEAQTEMGGIYADSKAIVAGFAEIGRISRDTAAQAQTVSAATQEQALTMKEIAAASTALKSMAEDLQQAVQSFKV